MINTISIRGAQYSGTCYSIAQARRAIDARRNALERQAAVKQARHEKSVKLFNRCCDHGFVAYRLDPDATETEKTEYELQIEDLIRYVKSQKVWMDWNQDWRQRAPMSFHMVPRQKPR
jgi:hypothetical protein